ncbi:protein containg RNHCP domain [Longilinea arvoryzae]|uniref:Protein containg RNHCP domain n=1 Tax=Longilinea arvoryzae TaxID=360412 RepID=A0A0S7BD04_9CHLR|nr:RNHCP domain-containing protein [Longilinea arvoryzae]GAP12307.1 protein containg RNHCP domain [Longilinea arvoryzae]
MTTSTFAQRTYTRSKGLQDTFGDFTCLHCRRLVQAHELFSGVRNRNHCPHCLSSRHLDLYEAGDRLAACKGRMRAVALTLKHNGNKYAADSGELMLVHVCTECGKVSINRIAADDDNDLILQIFHESQNLDRSMRDTLAQNGILALNSGHEELVVRRLWGRES